MSRRNLVAVILLVASYIAFVPGIFEPLITITGTYTAFGNEVEVLRETRSIVQTVRSLHESGNDLVAGLILLFGVIVPIVKGISLLAATFLHHRSRRLTDAFARVISKWAMNDVFVVGVYVAFLSARATDGLHAELEVGFYWFTAYVLTSLLALTLLHRPEATDTTA